MTEKTPYKVINACKVSPAEWRRLRPDSALGRSPKVLLESRTETNTEKVFCVSYWEPRVFGEGRWMYAGVSRSCYKAEDEAAALGTFNLLCKGLFPWRAKMKQRQVLS